LLQNKLQSKRDAGNITSIQSNFAKGRIAVLLPLAVANVFVRSWPYHGSLVPIKSAPKRHLDWFSRFCTAHPCDQHTDRQTHKPRCVRHLYQYVASSLRVCDAA